jgi:electron transport complex protein RnfG
MVFVLTLISSMSGLALSALDGLTKEQIKTTQLQVVYEPALKDLVQGYDNNPIADVVALDAGKDSKGRDIVKNVFPLKKGGQVFALGLAETASGGYGGDITIMLAVNSQTNEVLGVKVLLHKETKGLGTPQEVPFLGGFAGKSSADQLKTKALGGPIDGMSGATFSSTTVSKAAQSGYQYYLDNKDLILSKIK